MCERFNRNRAQLAKLIYQKASFATDQIINEFSKKQGGDIIIDGVETIADYLEELTEYGALSYEGGRYYVNSSEPRR